MKKYIRFDQWLMATKTKEEIKEFYYNKQRADYLWMVISRLNKEHPAVQEFLRLDNFVKEQIKSYNDYCNKYRGKLYDRLYRELQYSK